MKCFKYVLILVFISHSWSCKNTDEPTKIAPLKGTEWKLVGIVDVATNTLTTLEPEDCKDCYTFKFVSDITAQGRAVAVPEGIKNLYDFSDKFENTAMGELINDAELYRKIINSITSFTYENEELKLFYNDNKNYLLYKLIKP
jgi:hypothetical protein